MKYLDYKVMNRVLQQYFPDRAARMVGTGRNIDSGYINIVRFYGDCSVCPDDILIRYSAIPFEFSDPIIETFANKIEAELRAEGRIYHGPPATRLTSFNHTQATLQSCAYGKMAGSCFALDYPHTSFRQFGGTLREYYLRQFPKRTLEHHPLANCLGICGLLVARDGESRKMLMVHRSANLASLENSVGPSAAGSVDFKSGWNTLGDLINQSMSAEISEELCLSPDQYRIVPLALAAEIFRGEKPQLFCLIETGVSPNDLKANLHRGGRNSGEYDDWFWTDVDDHQSKDSPALNHETSMNRHLVMEYLAGFDQ